jgi:hypothetical protein
MLLRDILAWSAAMAGCQELPQDSQVYIEAGHDVRRVLFGIDIDATELLFARDAGYDAVIAHHPVGGSARRGIEKVVARQVDQMVAEGVPRESAEAVVAERLGEPHRRTHVANVNRVVDTARLIGVPLANIHLACDILGRTEIESVLAQRSVLGASVSDAISWLEEIPEMRASHTTPEAWLGSGEHPLGRYTVAMAGGLNGGHSGVREYFRAGVDTAFVMHFGEDDLRRLQADPLAAGRSLVVTGHMATDSIGVNLVIAGLERHGIEVTRTSGIVG